MFLGVQFASYVLLFPLTSCADLDTPLTYLSPSPANGKGHAHFLGLWWIVQLTQEQGQPRSGHPIHSSYCSGCLAERHNSYSVFTSPQPLTCNPEIQKDLKIERFLFW